MTITIYESAYSSVVYSGSTSTVQRSTTGLVYDGVCEYRGFKVLSSSGTVDVTVYDATSAAGTPIQTLTSVTTTGGNDDAGSYLWASGVFRENLTGVYVVISGTCVIDFMVNGV